MRIAKCIRCGKSHAHVDVEHTSDSKGRPRVRWVCPTTGKAVSQFAKADGAKPKTAKKRTTKRTTAPRKRTTNKGGTVPRKTTTTGTTPKSMRVSIPLTLDPEPDMAAAWDIAEGLLEGLAELRSDNSAIRQEAEAAYRAAKGVDAAADQTERAFGRALAKAVQLVAVKRGMSEAEWKALAPPGLFGGRDYLGGGIVDFAVGAEGESGAAGMFGDMFETAAGAALDAILPDDLGAAGDALTGVGTQLLGQGLRSAVTGGAL